MRDEPQEFEADSVGDFEADAAVPVSAEPPPVRPPQTETRPPRRRPTRSPAQRLVRLIIPVALLLYFLISSYFSNH